MDGPTLFFLLIVLSLLVATAIAISFSENDPAQDTLDGVPKYLYSVVQNLSYGSRLYTRSYVPMDPAINRKKALLFGLNYTGTSYRLFGCINDTKRLKLALETRGFVVETCTDETVSRPTYDIMIQKMKQFVESLKYNDVGFIWFSGHGALKNGRNAWVPLDFLAKGYIYEDTVRAILKFSKTKPKLIVGSDSCYSGSFFDLKYDVEPRGRIDTLLLKNAFFSQTRDLVDRPVQETVTDRVQELNEPIQAWPAEVLQRSNWIPTDTLEAYPHGSMYGSPVKLRPGVYPNDLLHYAVHWPIKSLVIPEGLEVTLYDELDQPHVLQGGTYKSLSIVPNSLTIKSLTSTKGYSNTVYDVYDIQKFTPTEYPVLFVSAGRDNQVAYDAYLEGQSQGALTWAFLRTIQSTTSGPLTLGLFQDILRYGLQYAKFPQVPQISLGTPIDPTTRLSAFGI
jgi:hypothetical protein